VFCFGDRCFILNFSTSHQHLLSDQSACSNKALSFSMMVCAFQSLSIRLYHSTNSFSADFWKDKWQNWKDSLTSGKTEISRQLLIFASEAGYPNDSTRI